MENLSKKILFVGAGASVGAREEFKFKPPLGLELCGWLRQICPDLYVAPALVYLHGKIKVAMEVLDKQINETNYEELVALLDREQRISLQRLLAIAFTDLTERRIKNEIDLGFKNQIDGFDELIGYLKIDTAWSIVSLNYDILLEEALRRKPLEFYYPQFPFIYNDDQSNAKGIKVLKPHGSINFFAGPKPSIVIGPGSRNVEDLEHTEYTWDEHGNAIPNYSRVMAALPGAENILHNIIAPATYPVMANYARGKKVDINSIHLEGVRHKALNTIKNAEEIYIIGVKPILDPADDSMVEKIFNSKGPKVTYVSPSKSDCETVARLNPKADIYCKTLLDFMRRPKHS